MSYLKHEIKENKLPVKCPGEKCKSEIEPSFIMQTFKKDEIILNKYLNFTLQKNKEISWCPTPDCNYGFMWKNEDPKFSCPKCKKVYCFKCKCEYHNEVKCEENKKNQESVKAEKEFLNLARKLKFKVCPKCKRWIEKDDGCNHITCYKCKFEFCYVCGKEYSSSHGDCEYKFIDPINIENENKSNKDDKKDKISNNKDNDRINLNTNQNMITRAANLNRINYNNNDTNHFNPFNHYSDLVNSIHLNSESRSFKIDNDLVEMQSNTSKFNALRDFRLNDEGLLSFNSTQKQIGFNKSSYGGPLKNDGTPDMRFAVNKNAKEIESETQSISTSAKSKKFFELTH